MEWNNRNPVEAAHKYVRPHSVISLLRPDIEGSSQICQTSNCYQPVWNRYRRQLTNMSDLTVLSACLEPISKAAHKYVRPHSVFSLLRPDIEGSSQICQTSHSVISLLRPDIEGRSQICQTFHSVISLLRPDTEGSSQICQISQCYQPVETRYRRQLTDMSDLTVLSACWDPISKAAHKYVRPHSVISLFGTDIEGSSQICQTSQCYQPVETRYRRKLTNMSDLSQCYQPVETRYRRQLTDVSDLSQWYQPVETRYRRQLTNMSDLTVLSACWDPISKAAHKYVRPHSVISLLRPDIELRQLTDISDLTVLSACWDPISKAAHKCQTSQCYQPVETRYRRQLTNMSDLTVLSACWDPISKVTHKYVRPHSIISLLRPDIEGSSQINQTSHSVISLLKPDIEGSSQISQTYHIVIRLLRPDIEGSSQICQTSHSGISLLSPDIEGSSQICQISQCLQPVESRYRRQLTNMSDFIVLSACWDPISKAAHKYVIPHSVISLLRPDIEGSSQICLTS